MIYCIVGSILLLNNNDFLTYMELGFITPLLTFFEGVGFMRRGNLFILLMSASLRAHSSPPERRARQIFFLFYRRASNFFKKYSF